MSDKTQKPNVKVLREHRLYDRLAGETRVVKVGEVVAKASYDDSRDSSFNWQTLVNTRPAKLVETNARVGLPPKPTEPAKSKSTKPEASVAPPAAPTAGNGE